MNILCMLRFISQSNPIERTKMNEKLTIEPKRDMALKTEVFKMNASGLLMTKWGVFLILSVVKCESIACQRMVWFAYVTVK